VFFETEIKRGLIIMKMVLVGDPLYRVNIIKLYSLKIILAVFQAIVSTFIDVCLLVSIEE